jgi:hypothetical protein
MTCTNGAVTWCQDRHLTSNAGLFSLLIQAVPFYLYALEPTPRAMNFAAVIAALLF